MFCWPARIRHPHVDKTVSLACRRRCEADADETETRRDSFHKVAVSGAERFLCEGHDRAARDGQHTVVRGPLKVAAFGENDVQR